VFTKIHVVKRETAHSDSTIINYITREVVTFEIWIGDTARRAGSIQCGMTQDSVRKANGLVELRRDSMLNSLTAINIYSIISVHIFLRNAG
jgi:hypothetical protein